jgi:hypothetical protein
MLTPRRLDMNGTLLDAEIGGIGRVVELGAAAGEADRRVWESAAEVLRQRAYGAARVVAEWPASRGEGAVRLPLRVTGGDAEWLAELFLHDAFLIFNLAAPGSFGGAVSIVGGNDFTLDARLFEYAWATAARGGAARIEALPLAQVAAWYDGLRVDAARAADTPLTRALFHLLHLARSAEDEVLSILRLAQTAEALGTGDTNLFTLRSAVVRPDAPVSHPALDDDERTLQRVDVADRAAAAVVAALQARIRKG